MPRSAKDHVSQVAGRISRHWERIPHMADCPRRCTDDLWFSSHGGHSHSSAITEDPNCRQVQDLFANDSEKCVFLHVFSE